MGPRLISRGVTIWIGRSVRRSKLQWGRGSLAAAWRPLEVAGAVTYNASMGPRLISRGVATARAAHGSCFHASMGPRLISRGVQQTLYTWFRTDRLQWGRGSLAAAWASLQTMGNTGLSEALASVRLREGCFVWLGLNGKNIKVDLSKT